MSSMRIELVNYIGDVDLSVTTDNQTFTSSSQLKFD